MNRFMFSVALFSILLISQEILAQKSLPPRPSPLDITTYRYHDTYVKITYSRPHKRGRDIFGGLVPYGEVWRTGANEATEITVTGDMEVNGKLLPAGTYSIFTIPEKDNWTIIFNQDLGLWGSTNYNPDHDALRTEVESEVSDTQYEPFTIKFQHSGLKETNLMFIWDNTLVKIPVKFIDD